MQLHFQSISDLGGLSAPSQPPIQPHRQAMAARHFTPLKWWNIGSYVSSIAVSHDGTRISSGSADGLVRVWDVHTGALVLGPLEGHASGIRSVAWSHDDTRLVSGSYDSTIRLWNALTGAPIASPLRGHIATVRSVAFSHDSSRIVSGSRDKTIRIWDAHAGVPIGKPLRGHTDEVNSVAFSTDNSRIVSGASDHTVRIWDAHTGSLIDKPLEGHTSWIWSVAFSHDSTRIISGSSDETIRVWDACTGAPIGEPLRGHTFSVYSVAFSHDSTRIVSDSWDNTIRIWDARTSAPIGEPLRGHTSYVYSVAFSPDSTRIISGSNDTTISVWEVPPSTPSFDMVTSDMSVEDMFGCLVQHGCADVSPLLASAQLSLTPIANGGFGDVWRVTLSDGSVIAVKTLRLPKLLAGNAKGAKRAVREVHHWSKLQHLNVQQLLGVVIFRGGLGMVSPWMENGHLKQYLAQRPDVPRYPLCLQLASGLSYLHSVEMVHGDLKANNVLVSDDGILKINDFDYAVLSDSTLRFSTTTRQGGGTLRWMAPELFQPEAPNAEGGAEPVASRTKATDIYALGMAGLPASYNLIVHSLHFLQTLLEIVTGNVPYAEYRSDMGIYRAISRKKPPKQPKQLSLPEPQITPVWELLINCWNHDPSSRPDAASVLVLLESMVS